MKTQRRDVMILSSNVRQANDIIPISTIFEVSIIN